MGELGSSAQVRHCTGFVSWLKTWIDKRHPRHVVRVRVIHTYLCVSLTIGVVLEYVEMK